MKVERRDNGEVERRDNGDVVLHALNGDPLLKLQHGNLGDERDPPFLVVVQGDHPLDVRASELTPEAIEAVRESVRRCKRLRPRLPNPTP